MSGFLSKTKCYKKILMLFMATKANDSYIRSANILRQVINEDCKDYDNIDYLFYDFNYESNETYIDWENHTMYVSNEWLGVNYQDSYFTTQVKQVNAFKYFLDNPGVFKYDYYYMGNTSSYVNVKLLNEICAWLNPFKTTDLIFSNLAVPDLKQGIPIQPFIVGYSMMFPKEMVKLFIDNLDIVENVATEDLNKVWVRYTSENLISQPNDNLSSLVFQRYFKSIGQNYSDHLILYKGISPHRANAYKANDDNFIKNSVCYQAHSDLLWLKDLDDFNTEYAKCTKIWKERTYTYDDVIDALFYFDLNYRFYGHERSVKKYNNDPKLDSKIDLNYIYSCKENLPYLDKTGMMIIIENDNLSYLVYMLRSLITTWNNLHHLVFVVNSDINSIHSIKAKLSNFIVNCYGYVDNIDFIVAANDSYNIGIKHLKEHNCDYAIILRNYDVLDFNDLYKSLVCMYGKKLDVVYANVEKCFYDTKYVLRSEIPNKPRPLIVNTNIDFPIIELVKYEITNIVIYDANYAHSLNLNKEMRKLYDMFDTCKFNKCKINNVEYTIETLTQNVGVKEYE